MNNDHITPIHDMSSCVISKSTLLFCCAIYIVCANSAFLFKFPFFVQILLSCLNSTFYADSAFCAFCFLVPILLFVQILPSSTKFYVIFPFLCKFCFLCGFHFLCRFCILLSCTNSAFCADSAFQHKILCDFHIKSIGILLSFADSAFCADSAFLCSFHCFVQILFFCTDSTFLCRFCFLCKFPFHH